LGALRAAETNEGGALGAQAESDATETNAARPSEEIVEGFMTARSYVISGLRRSRAHYPPRTNKSNRRGNFLAPVLTMASASERLPNPSKAHGNDAQIVRFFPRVSPASHGSFDATGGVSEVSWTVE
jgi:hypothetical protein